MGWLSALTKIGLMGAAPFTGGATLAALPLVDKFSGGGGAPGSDTGGGGMLGGVLSAAGDIGTTLGKQQEGAAQGRVAEAGINQKQDQNALQKYGLQQGAEDKAAQLDLDRKKYTDDSRAKNTKNAIVSALMGNVQPSSISVPGVQQAHISGGLLEALKSNPDALAAAAEMQKQSSSALTNPAAFTGGQMVQAPTLTPVPQQSGGSKFLDVLSRIGQIAGSAGSAFKTSNS